VETERRVTVHDLAKIAGVSAMSVSRVLSGNRPVTEETARRVNQAIDATGFRLNRTARNLRQQRTLTTIAMVVDRLGDPFFSKLIHAAQNVATEHSAILVAASETSGTAQADLVPALVDRGVDGLLVQPTTTRWESQVRNGPAVALLSRTGGLDGFDGVLVDNVEGARVGIAHLLALGHRRIAVIDYGTAGPPRWREKFVDTRADRFLGLQLAYRDAGLEYDQRLWFTAGPTVEDASRATLAATQLDDPPTAFFGLHGRMTLGIVSALGPGLDGFGLVGVDDFELADMLTPRVTVVTQDPSAIGRKGAELVFARLSDPSVEVRRIEQPMELVVRGSGQGSRL
jgi:LacI family transcriptional regulator